MIYSIFNFRKNEDYEENTKLLGLSRAFALVILYFGAKQEMELIYVAMNHVSGIVSDYNMKLITPFLALV